MGNPSCPYGCGTLKMETINYRSDETMRNPDSRADFYICYGCKKHWPRTSVISKNTARDGVKPKGRMKL